MIPQFLGMVIVVATLGTITAALAAILLGQLRRRAEWIRLGRRLAAGAIAGYGILWLVGFATSPWGPVGAGGELDFCGLDCHLHVSAVRATRGEDLAVTVRFRSDAKQADEFPGHLELAVVDQAGRRYPATTPSDPAERLGAGATIEREIRFSVPPGTDGLRLQVSWNGWLDYLVPGRGNRWVQRRTPLALEAARR